MAVHVLGIRHHGPGSARSVARALDALAPDCVLIEGPPELTDIVAFVDDPSMVPPIAGFVFATDRPSLAVFDPFASFSPEWIALRYARTHGVPVRFVDLPAVNDLARRAALIDEWEKRIPLPAPVDALADDPDGPVSASVSEPGPEGDTVPSLGARARLDPIGTLADLAGVGDAERWWEDVVEHRVVGPSGGEDNGDPLVRALAPFAAITEAMRSLRDAADEATDPISPNEVLREAQREASMRQGIRQAEKDGYTTIAVVCGAWHAPVLERSTFPSAAADAATLKGLPKLKVTATWVPWTHRLLSRLSGYGAGVNAPGWYDHVFRFSESRSSELVSGWMVKTARALRDHDYDASPASVIEAVRLAENLAALRSRPLPGLDEVNDATVTVLCGGSAERFATVVDTTHTDQRLGSVPESAPQVPLAVDLAQQQKKLRLKQSAMEETLELDLRTQAGLARSQFFHRLLVLGIAWARPTANATRTTGTFKESWVLEWKPEFAIPIVEASQWGTTIEAAATAKAADGARSSSLPALTELLDNVLRAALEAAVDGVLAAVADVAAASDDLSVLLDAVPTLARIARYGDVRKTDQTAVGAVLAGIVTRVCAGLPGASSQLDDDAARVLRARINAMNTALGTVNDDDQRRQWTEALQRVHAASAHLGSVHPLVGGTASRLLHDGGSVDNEAVANTMSQVLSRGSDPMAGVQWVEGFFGSGGLVLVHDEALLRIVDGWMATVSRDTFDDVLPLLRRTFGSFAAGERRMIGSAVRNLSSGGSSSRLGSSDDGGVDLDRGSLAIPTVLTLLGVGR